jgi:hypothetical protein
MSKKFRMRIMSTLLDNLAWRIEANELIIDTSRISKKPCEFAWCFKVQVN